MWLHRSSEFVLVAERLAQPSQLHAHYALQFSVSLGAPLWARVGSTLLDLRGAILFGSNVPHTLSGDVLHAFVDPLSALGRRLRAMLGLRPYLCLSSALTQAVVAATLGSAPALDAHAAPELVAALLSELPRTRAGRTTTPLDPRIGRVLEVMRAEQGQRLPLELLADTARLSQSRLTHLFSEQVGMPIKQYTVWLRMLAALEGLNQPGAQLGTLAHATGFPDQAAFSRSYRKMWGRTPSAYQKAAQAAPEAASRHVRRAG